MLDSIKQTLKTGSALVFTADEAKKFAKLCKDSSSLKQIAASAFLSARDETLETCKILAKLNIINSSKGRIFKGNRVNDTFILYLEKVIEQDHFVNNMLELCYASGGAIRPSQDAPICIVDKVKTIRQFLFNNHHLKTLLNDVRINQHHTNCEKLSIINSALIFGYDVNALDPYRQTALILAAWNGYTDIVKTLLQRKEIDVNIQDVTCSTALICAAYKGETDIAKALLQNKDIDINIRDRNYKTALRIAIEEDRIEIVQLLVQKLSKDSGIDVRTLLQAELRAQIIKVDYRTITLPAINTTTPEELIQKFTTNTEMISAATELVGSEMLSASKEGTCYSIYV